MWYGSKFNSLTYKLSTVSEPFAEKTIFSPLKSAFALLSKSSCPFQTQYNIVKLKNKIKKKSSCPHIDGFVSGLFC